MNLRNVVESVITRYDAQSMGNGGVYELIEELRGALIENKTGFNRGDRRYLRDLLERDIDWMLDYAQNRRESLAWARRIDRITRITGIRLNGKNAVFMANEMWDKIGDT